MRIARKPKVTLLAWQEFAKPEHIAWETEAPTEGEALVEFAGRTCYQSYQNPGSKTNREYIEHLLEVGHGSVLEHWVATFLIEDVSRSLTHELVRHRAGFAYSQLSQRYVDESEAAFVEPACIAEDVEAHAIWLEAIERSQEAYVRLVELLKDKFKEVEDRTQRRKMARQAARSVLPNATETKIVVTANARAWRHFVEMRATAEADVEIRALAIEVLKQLQGRAPNLFGDYVIRQLADGTEAAESAHRKV
jgi:thymidylate synthase (FAD)